VDHADEVRKRIGFIFSALSYLLFAVFEVDAKKRGMLEVF